MTRVATLEALITADTSGLTKGLSAAQGKLGGFKGGLNDAVRGLTGMDVATLGTAAAVGALAAGLKYSISQAAESEAVMAQTEAVIKSTGSAAGLTAAQIGTMSQALSASSTFSDEAIQKGQNLLLTFTNIGHDVFPQATAAMIDMATAMGTDASSGAIQLGKALQDPVAGISALTRVGVTFSAEQKKLIESMVKTGDVAGAQKIIIAELNKEFGGSAQAALGTYAGKMAQLQNNVDNLAESIGNQLLPPLSDAVGALNLLLTYSDRVEGSLAEHAGTVEDTAQSYKEYSDELVRAAKVAGYVVDAQGNLVRVFSRGGPVVKEVVQETYVLTEAEYAAAKAAEEFGVAAYVAGNKLRQANEETYNSVKAAQAATDRYQGMADALGVAGEASDRFAYLQNKAADAAQLLAAGLAGRLGDAQDDYRQSLAETTPEIARLTAEIEKYRAEQGRTFTFTQDATTSANEFENATLKAALAVKELSEFTGDDALELSNLKVKADDAQESVVKLGEGLGFSKDFTIDHTKALAEDNVKLGEAVAAQDAAAAAIKRATAEFILQQAAAALGAEGALEFAHATGLITEADYQVTKSVQDLTAAFDTNGDGSVTAAEGLAAYQVGLKQIYDGTVNATSATDDLIAKADEMPAELVPAAEAFAATALAADSVTTSMSLIPVSIQLDTVPAITSLDQASARSDYFTTRLDRIPTTVAVDTSSAIGSLDAAAGSANGVTSALNNIPRSVTSDIYINRHEQTQDGGGGHYAAGVDMFVPPGFPNDSYMIGVQSGERVQVTPAGGTGGSGNGNGTTYNFHFNNSHPITIPTAYQTARAVAGAMG